jgi:hypothetical protein
MKNFANLQMNFCKICKNVAKIKEEFLQNCKNCCKNIAKIGSEFLQKFVIFD